MKLPCKLNPGARWSARVGSSRESANAFRYHSAHSLAAAVIICRHVVVVECLLALAAQRTALCPALEKLIECASQPIPGRRVHAHIAQREVEHLHLLPLDNIR